MKITSTVSDSAVLLALDGRLDSSWSEPVVAALDEAIRSGRSRIELDMSAVSFVSSVGIGAILRANVRFRAVKGVLAIVAASDNVREMLRLSRLDALLHVGVPAPAAAPRAVAATTPFGRGWTGELATMGHTYAHANVEFMRNARLTLDADTIALGHFALAGSIEDARGLFGDGIAVGGTVAVAPAGSPRPDCLVSGAHEFVSCIARDAVVVRGKPSLQGHFEHTAEAHITLSSLASALVEHAGGAVAFTAIGESDGAFGAWARVSPDEWKRPLAEMQPDEIRANLRFAGERMHAGASMAVVAIACARDTRDTLPPEVASTLVDVGSCLLHAHVALVSYRPVPRSTTNLRTAGELLAEQPLRSVMHALRAADGTESGFVRGSVWAMRIGRAGAGGSR